MLSVEHDLKDPYMGNNMILKLDSHSFHIPALPPLFFDGTLESGRLAFLPQVSEEGRGLEKPGEAGLCGLECRSPSLVCPRSRRKC